MADPMRADVFNSMYGYGAFGPQLPPPVVLTTTFWDDQKIQETVNIRFLREKLLHDSARKKLDSQLTFGEGLTESTYSEWILEHTKRFFLIFLELGCPEKIFDIIDESWDDEDLPLSMDSIARLNLGSSVEKKFSKKQYQFLVRDLKKGGHVDYDDEELVPLEILGQRHPGRSASSIDKVYFPRQRDVFYTRKRVLLGDDPDPLQVDSLMAEIDAMKYTSHPHIVSLHSSYTHQGACYMIISPCIELNLRHFLQYPPIAFKNLPKDQRRRIVFNWMHCLADALAYLSEKGFSHGKIQPSTIIIEPTTHHIFFAEIGGNPKRGNPASINMGPLDMASHAKVPTGDVEAYEYGAPEQWLRSLASHESTSPPSNTVLSGRGYRRTSHTSVETSPTSSSSIHLGQWTKVTSAPSKSDTFSLGCIFLDILTFVFKRKASAFSAHRCTKNRRSRESAPPDASFHANIGQVESWMDILEKDAKKKGYVGFTQVIDLCREMLQREPGLRQEPRVISDRLYRIALPAVKPEMPHCGLHKMLNPDLALFGGWEGMDGPRDRKSSNSSGVSSKLSIVTTTSSSLSVTRLTAS
ncbi:hypothetical protein RUND412_009574 [Rhizina undulata]